ncbi:MAG: malectin domain-containing carbohydrate-binding protein [Ginsengibacter sp.]
MKSKDNRTISIIGSREEKDLFSPIGKGPFTRGLFLRSIFLGTVSLGFQKAGYSNKKAGLHNFGKCCDFSTATTTSLKHYYGHDAVVDRYGVIAPWYQQLNGQCDFRIRIAAETMKRYPWTTTKTAAVSYPDYLFTSNWGIAQDGEITTKHFGDWSNGDLGQRAVCVLEGMVNYYRYTGDAAAIAHLTYMGDYVLDYCLTPAGHPWPEFPISVPVKGKAYGKADAKGMIQLDICGAMGEQLLRAYQVTKNQRWLDAAKHWGDLFAENCNTTTNGPPWPRYANPESVQWQDHPRMNLQTGSVIMILNFLDELMKLGYSGKNGRITLARDAGRRYLADRLLPEWSLDKTWGCYFWDWIHDMQECVVTAKAAGYMIKHKDHFPNWRNDTRNILTVFLNRSSADPLSGGDVYNGAWAYPESSMCCQRSLWYSPLVIAPTMIKYGVAAGDAHMRELGYRQMVLQTYDVHESGVSEDVIDGGTNVNNDWLAIAVPLPLAAVLDAIAWLPEELGASRENHLVRSTSVVDAISYGKGTISYSTFDAPQETIDVFRLSYTPSKIAADGQTLSRRNDLTGNGYMVNQLPNADTIVTIRHDGLKKVIVKGSDPQSVLKSTMLKYDGQWVVEKDDSSFSGAIRIAENKGTSFTTEFYGNQVRLTGRTDTLGGQADVFIDGIQQLVFIDFWNPSPRAQQVLYYKNGLQNGKHTLKIVARGSGNPYSQGSKLYIDTLQYSSAEGAHHFTTGTGPVKAQRMIFGYTKREDYRDSKGNFWRPATEVVTPLSKRQDPVAQCWMKETMNNITNTPDPELYRFGCKSNDFWVNITVGPGKYGVRLLFAITQEEVDYKTGFDIIINEKTAVKNFNLPGTAKGLNSAVDLVFPDIAPNKGIIQIRFKANNEIKTNAFVQALEIDPQLQAGGITPLTYSENS